MPLFKKEDKETLLRCLKKKDYKDDEEKKGLLTRLKEIGDIDPLDVLWMVFCQDKDLQSFAEDVWLSVNNPARLLQHLLIEMKNQKESGRQKIAILIGKLELPIKFYLSKMIQSEDEKERIIAMEILANHPKWQNYMGVVRMALRDSRTRVRYMAVVRLGSAATDERVFLMLRKMCEDPAEIVRHEVLRIMTKLDTPDVIQPFFERLPYEPPSIQQEIIEALISLSKKGKVEIEDYIFPALLSEEKLVRNAATELLREVLRGERNKAEILRKLFIYTRGIAFWLRDLCFDFVKRLGQDGVEPLISLMEDPEDDVRMLAMFLASEIRDERIIPVVKRMLVNEKEWWMRVFCVNILGKFKTTEMTHFLLSFIDDPDLQWSVITSLGKIGDPHVVEHLLKKLKDPRKGIRMVTLDALWQFPIPNLLSELKVIYETDPDLDVREKAFHLIQGLANKGDEEAAEIVEERHRRGLSFLEGGKDLNGPQ